MIDQLPLYFLCYFLGWFPLYYGYRKVELWVPLPVKKSSAVFSTLPLMYGVYMVLEIFRGVFLMHVLHEWLAFDMDLVVGLVLWLFGIGFPFFLSSVYRTRVWLSILGVYGYLFPMAFWLIPMVLMGLFFTKVSPWVSHGLVGVLFIIIGWAQGGNSLYMSVYVGLFLYLLIKTLPMQQTQRPVT